MARCSATIKRDDIPAINNLRPNPFLINGTTVPTGWSLLADQFGGNPTVSKDTTDFFSRFGLVSWRIQANKDQGLVSSTQTVRFRAGKEHITWGVALWVISGSFRIVIEDHSFPTSPEHPFVYFPEISNVPARTSETGRWIELYVFPGVNFLNLGSSLFQFKLFAEEDGSECYFDADQLVRRAHPRDVPNFWDGSGGQRCVDDRARLPEGVWAEWAAPLLRYGAHRPRPARPRVGRRSGAR